MAGHGQAASRSPAVVSAWGSVQAESKVRGSWEPSPEVLRLGCRDGLLPRPGVSWAPTGCRQDSHFGETLGRASPRRLSTACGHAAPCSVQPLASLG